MGNINLFTALNYGDAHKTTRQFLIEKVDDYFYLGGRKAQIMPEEKEGEVQGVKWVKESSTCIRKSIKIVSYCTLIIPLIMLVAKLILRMGLKFYILKPLFNLDDFISYCAPNQQAMIYGTAQCGYAKIGHWLDEQQANGQFKDVFDCFLGQEEDEKAEEDSIFPCKTSDNNRVIKKIKHGTPLLSKSQCKAALVNMVVENVKRKKDGLPTIPVIFVLEKDDIKLDVISIVERGLPFSKGFTNSEMRRAYKLCFDSMLSPEVRSTALETFLFMSLTTNAVDHPVKFSFKMCPAPWTSQEWGSRWENRMKTKVPSATPKAYPWREELQKILHAS